MMRSCLALVLVAVAAAQDTPAPHDWSKDVERACTSRRYGLRLAAARKVGKAGDAAVPAIRAFQQKNGKDAIPTALVEAVATDGGNGEAVLGLLEDWAFDREFFWRAQAMRGLALRADDPDLAERYRARFLEHGNDAAWLVRVYARFGYERAAAHAPDAHGGSAFPPETDPRAQTKLAALREDALAAMSALGDERSFLGDPWGRRRANEAWQLLKPLVGDDTGYKVGAPFDDNRDAIAKVKERIAARAEAQPPAVARLIDPDTEFAGGIEVLSCRNGDLFVRWTHDGRVFFGLESDRSVQIPPDLWRELSTSATALQLPSQSGVVICDKMRIAPGAGHKQAAVAPNAMPAPAADWLKQLAAAIEETGNGDLAAALRNRLEQFATN